jgi:ribulose 1,5-bisphosphate carboxylase large subunit-like protein
MQAADLRLCRTAVLTSPARGPRLSVKRPWSLRERLDERDIAKLITAYRDGATAASLAATHGVSPRSVKRLLRTAGVRRISATRQVTKATPVATHP